jgi:pyruvate kinase
MRQVKIVATIGPATCSPLKLESLLDAGINVARFDMSQGTPAWHNSTPFSQETDHARQPRRLGLAKNPCGGSS